MARERATDRRRPRRPERLAPRIRPARPVALRRRAADQQDVWVWPRGSHGGHEKARAGRGEPSSGPDRPQLAGGEPAGNSKHCTTSGQGSCDVPSRVLTPTATPQAAQVGAGPNISAKPANPTAVAEGRNVAEPGANGSFAAIGAEDRDGNSRAVSFCWLPVKERLDMSRSGSALRDIGRGHAESLLQL